MKPLVLKIKGIDTIIKCLKPVNDSTYIDSINKAFNYLDISQASIVVRNICDTGFILPVKYYLLKTRVLTLRFSSIDRNILDLSNSANHTFCLLLHFTPHYN